MDLRRYIDILSEEERKSYQSLADAGDEYKPGNIQVWYKKKNVDVSIDEFESKNLLKTHSLIGTLRETNPRKIFSLMQGENYSPKGEASMFLSKKGVSHTSISNGDIIRSKNKMLMLTANGWKNVKK